MYLRAHGRKNAVGVEVAEVALQDGITAGVPGHVQHDGSHVRLSLLQVTLPEADVRPELRLEKEKAYRRKEEHPRHVSPPVRFVNPKISERQNAKTIVN